MSSPEQNQPPGSPLPWHRLVAELNRTMTLRRELATLELTHDRQLLVRSAILGGAGLVAAIVGLSQLTHALARVLAAVTALQLTAWLWILGGTLLLAGTVTVLFVYRRARAQFCGLAATRAELNEDLVWLRDWSGTASDDQ